MLSIDGPASVSLALATAAAASQDGAWVAAVGFPSLGLLAAAELGVALERFVLVASPKSGRRSDTSGREADTWASAVAALVDAFEIVLVQADHPIRARDSRRLVARVREQESVLVQVGSRSWAEGADVTFRVASSTWEGLGEGYGHLQARRVTVDAGSRREAARPRSADLWLPSIDGLIEPVLDEPVPLHAQTARSGWPDLHSNDDLANQNDRRAHAG